jgi:hypothetical protein
MTTLDLTPFLATEADDREYLRAPWRCTDGVVATNGHVLVCVADDGGQYADAPNGMSESVARFRAYLDEPDRVWTDVASIHLPTIPVCSVCKGVGHTHYVDCDECDGKGEFKNGSHTYECKECNGEGRIRTSRLSDGAKQRPCYACDGSGQGFLIVKVNGVALQAKYLHRLKALPGCSIGTRPSQPLDTVVFRFDGGFGAIMPCRE